MPCECAGNGVPTGSKWRQLKLSEAIPKELALCISQQCACQLLVPGQKCNWAVSYPSAFSPNEARNYRRQLAADLCQELTL